MIEYTLIIKSIKSIYHNNSFEARLFFGNIKSCTAYDFLQYNFSPFSISKYLRKVGIF